MLYNDGMQSGKFLLEATVGSHFCKGKFCGFSFIIMGLIINPEFYCCPTFES